MHHVDGNVHATAPAATDNQRAEACTHRSQALHNAVVRQGLAALLALLRAGRKREQRRCALLTYDSTKRKASTNRTYTAISSTPSNQVLSPSCAMALTVNATLAMTIIESGLENTSFIGFPSA